MRVYPQKLLLSIHGESQKLHLWSFLYNSRQFGSSERLISPGNCLLIWIVHFRISPLLFLLVHMFPWKGHIYTPSGESDECTLSLDYTFLSSFKIGFWRSDLQFSGTGKLPAKLIFLYASSESWRSYRRNSIFLKPPHHKKARAVICKC